MKKTNHKYFEELPTSLYFKTSEDAKILTKTSEELLTEIGFEKSSGGFLAIHRRHAHAADMDSLAGQSIPISTRKCVEG